MACYCIYLSIIIAFCYVVKCENATEPIVIQKLSFNLTVHNETFITSPNNGELIKITKSGMTARVKCVNKYVGDEKIAFYYYENSNPFLIEYKVDILPSSINYCNEFKGRVHKLDYNVEGIGFNPLQIQNEDLVKLMQNKSSSELIESVNQPDNEEYITFILGECPVKFGYDNLKSVRSVYWMDANINIDVEKTWSTEECFNQNITTREVLADLDYMKSKIISNNTTFLSSSVTVINALQFIPDFNKTVPVKIRFNVTVVFDGIDELTQFDSFYLEKRPNNEADDYDYY